MKWITKEHIRVGRMGCAWLIQRFVDPAAEFVFLPGGQLHAEAERLGATLFHAEGAELARRGDISSFEVLLEHFGLAGDPALALLGRIVNTADIKQSLSPAGRAGAAGDRRWPGAAVCRRSRAE